MASSDPAPILSPRAGTILMLWVTMIVAVLITYVTHPVLPAYHSLTEAFVAAGILATLGSLVILANPDWLDKHTDE